MHFSQRFRGRMMQCCEDVSESVQAAAINLVTAMNRVGHLEPEDVERVVELVFSSEAMVARAAADLFVKVCACSNMLRDTRAYFLSEIFLLSLHASVCANMYAQSW